MSERTTGATDEQIEAALDRWCTLNDFRAMWRGSYQTDVEEWAEALVPEGYVIARAADVLTADQRADIAIALAVVESYDTTPVIESKTTVIVDPKDWNAIDHGISDALIVRLAAIANGGTDGQ